MYQSNKRLKIWEAALLCAFALTLLASCWAQGRQRALADGLIRLHVIAADDSEQEQALKLRVRDAVLACLEPKLEGMSDAAEAAETVRASLGEIRLAAESASEGRSVAVALGQERYPLRQYEGFALPAGEYRSLRVPLRGGQGNHWGGGAPRCGPRWARAGGTPGGASFPRRCACAARRTPPFKAS